MVYEREIKIQYSIVISHLNSIARMGQTGLPASRTAAGTGKPRAILERKTASETFTGPNRQMPAFGRHGSGDMIQVVVNFLFFDADHAR